MTWHIALALFFFCTTIGSITRRKFALATNHDASLIGLVQHTGIILPLGYLWSKTQPAQGITSVKVFWLYTILAAMAGAVFNILSHKSQKTVDAGQFAVIGTIATPLIVVLSTIVLNESLSLQQILGMLIIIAGVSTVIGKQGSKAKAKRKHIWYAVTSAILTGLAIVLERFAINAASTAMYVVVGWLIQTVIFAMISRKKIAHIAAIKKHDMLHIIVMALARFGSFIMFLTAVGISGNVSLISAIASFRTVIICAVAFIFLNERDRLWQKIVGSGMATLGLLLM